MIEEESETTVEESKLVKETFNVELVEGDSSKVRKIGRELQSPLKEEIINFLKGNLDIFSWSHGDVHNIDRRVFAPAQNKVVIEEVDKLLTAGLICEVCYPKWLVNIIMVKKNPMENGGCV